MCSINLSYSPSTAILLSNRALSHFFTFHSYFIWNIFSLFISVGCHTIYGMHLTGMYWKVISNTTHIYFSHKSVRNHYIQIKERHELASRILNKFIEHVKLYFLILIFFTRYRGAGRCRLQTQNRNIM